jgi:hypothetical protein
VDHVYKNMKRARIAAWKNPASLIALGFLFLVGLGQSTPARYFLASAQEFAGYYRTLGTTSVRAGFWDRVGLSLVLAGSRCPDPLPGKPTPAS